MAMLRRLLHLWESLPARHQIMVATPIAFVLLFLIHASGLFPLLTIRRALTYALMECIPVALVVTFATQTELARRASAAENDDLDSEDAG
jgi:hypothetical protein